MKVIVIGGVAGGTKFSAKLKREYPDSQVVIYTKSKDISYAGCGLPYYVGGLIENREQLVVNTPQKYSTLTGVEVHTESEVTYVDTKKKEITVNGEQVSFDKLVIASGASPFIPKIEGIDLKGVFSVRTPDDAVNIRDFAKNSKNALVVGGGFIGLEMAENLMAQGLNVTLIDMANQLLPNILDEEMADYIRRNLQERGLRIMLSTQLTAIRGAEGVVNKVITSNGEFIEDMVIMSVGIKPNTKFLENSGIVLDRGCVVVDKFGKTNIEDIYAVGDCALVNNLILGKKQWSAMGSTANIFGRVLALSLAGEDASYNGCLGTGVVKLSNDLKVGRTGLTEKQAIENGYNVITALTVGDDKAHYYPDSDIFITKLIVNKEDHKLLGMQVIGGGNVDKMTDIAVVGINAKLKVEDFVTMDFAYAPPFSTAIHPFSQACCVLLNKLTNRMDSFTPNEYIEGKANQYTVIDAQPVPGIAGAEWIDFASLDDFVNKHKKDEKLLLVCARGKRGYLTQIKLKSKGFTNTKVLEGGITFNVLKKKQIVNGVIPQDEVKRVKGLGCLQDKRNLEYFNVRVITRNGKITTTENRAIIEAAEKFGSGEITMTSRLAMEIQGVHFNNIDPLIEFLAQNNLETGGTGSKVRPVVSCKGTTCQYGLIDTFSLSEKIHEIFYRGYHNVTLPHKFKIAVGGCPNNCVKPDLNDLGIIGQRQPMFNFAKCRGCKVCQVEKNCPIKIASLKNGKLVVDQNACNGCGRCKGKCPFGVTEEYINGYKIYIGGRWGKKMANGRPLSKLFLSEEEVIQTVEKAILFFRNEGITGERFADTIARLGFEYAENKILNENINKNEILKKEVKGGATC